MEAERTGRAQRLPSLPLDTFSLFDIMEQKVRLEVESNFGTNRRKLRLVKIRQRLEAGD